MNMKLHLYLMNPKAETCAPESLTPEILSLKASKTEILGDTIKIRCKTEIFSFQYPEKNFFSALGIRTNFIIVLPLLSYTMKDEPYLFNVSLLFLQLLIPARKLNQTLSGGGDWRAGKSSPNNL